MNKLLVLLSIFSLLLIPQVALGQEANGEETQTSEEKIDQIKEKITNRVAELDLVEKRGIVGTVESVTAAQIRVNDLNDKTRIIEVDEITKYSSPNTSGFNLDNVEDGSRISVIGLYNKDSEKLLARFVNEISIPVFLTGVISEIDDEEFTVTLSTENEKDYLVDIENITRSFSFEDEDLETSGFTNFEVLQNAIIIGFPDSEEEGRISATRVIIFPDVPNNPNIEVEIPEQTEENEEDEDDIDEELSPTSTP